jgi:hypothetical protein
MRLWGVAVLVLVVAACAPSQASITTAIAQTQAAQPTVPPATATQIPTLAPTETPIPLAEIDLAPLLALPGDLPAGVGTGQIRRGPDVVSRDMPAANQAIQLQFSKDDEPLGAVVVWLYEQPETVLDAYRTQAGRLMESENYQVVAEIGDHAGGIAPDPSAALALEASGLGSFVDKLVGELAFARCHAVIYIALPYAGDTMVPMAAYARSLDDRLQAAVCRGDGPIVTQALVSAGQPMKFEGEGPGETPVFFLPPGKVSVKWTHSGDGSFHVTLRSEGSAAAIKIAEGSGSDATNVRLDVPSAGNYYFNVSMADGAWGVEVFP